MDKQQNLVEALKLWELMTEFDGSRNSFTIGQWEVQDMSKAIRQALELDDTNITGFLILGYYAEKFISSKSFPLTDLLEKAELVSAFVDRAQKLRELLANQDMLDDVAHFQLVTRQAVRHYGADTKEVMDLIESRADLGLLRRDALHSMQQLRVDYFTQGEPEASGVRPLYNKAVYQYWNINSMLRALCSSPSGVSLNLIRTPDNYQSYFVFAIRNGGHIITLSDIPEYAHPLAQYMSRRPERDFGKRMMQNWFPYDLLNLKYDEESGDLWIEKQDFGNAVTPINQTAFPLSDIKDLGACEVVWITLMLELIVQRFWRKPVAPQQLSYTGEMVKARDALISQATASNLPVIQYQGIEVEDFKTDDVAKPDEEMTAALGKSGGDHNQWLLDRYSARVNPQVLNLLSTGSVTAYLTNKDEDGTLPRLVPTKDYEAANRFYSDREGKYFYQKLDTASFGSKEQLIQDRFFLARHNLAIEIQRLADAEYEARKDEISTWYKGKIEDNLDALLALACQEECWIEKTGANAPSQVGGVYLQVKGGIRYRLAKVYSHEAYKKDALYIGSGHTVGEGYNSRTGRHYCAVNGTGSSWLLSVTPHTAEELALVTGVSVADLPDVLQHWVSDSRHRGNHLLSRIDPVAWALHDPWIKAQFAIKIWLSTRAYNSIRKTMHIPNEPRLFASSRENLSPYKSEWDSRDE